MARTLCQQCGNETESWNGACPSCGSTKGISLEPARDPLIGKFIAGRYRILDLLGQGGMGTVYLAEQEGLGHRVALKFLSSQFSRDPDVARRFLNEAKSYARVSHPNAVALHDFGQDEQGNLFIAMELVEGQDLKRVLTERGRLPPNEAVDLTLQIADVLGYAHAKGVIHRDLKPENIMLRQSMRGAHVKVLDFGIARLLDGGARMTQQGSIAGTPRYMAPEQVEGADVDARADIYALGVLLYELLTGVDPFGGATVSEILRNQLTRPMPHLTERAPDLALPELDAVIQTATMKQRDDRYPSMATFAAALSNAVPGANARQTMMPLQLTSPVESQSVRPQAGPGEMPAPFGKKISDTLVRAAVDPLTVPLPAKAPRGFDKTSFPEAVQRPARARTPLFVGAAAVLVLAVGGAVFAFKSPATSEAPRPFAVPRIEVPRGPPGSSELVNNVAPQLKKDPLSDPAVTNAKLQLHQAQKAFNEGNISETEWAIESVPDHDAVREDLARLKDAIADAKARLETGMKQSNQGDCDAAIRTFDALLKKYPQMRDARTARKQCKDQRPPDRAE